jgi:hypothetical protein
MAAAIDPAALRQVASKFRLVAETLQDAAGQVVSGAQAVTYVGPYGDRFRAATNEGMGKWRSASALASAIADQLIRAASQAEQQQAAQASAG